MTRPYEWRKSSRSASSGNCAEVAANVPGVVAIRDSKNPDGPKLTFAPAEWDAFIAAVRNGEFDLG
jgi:Domain of unknown function (DUF397)